MYRVHENKNEECWDHKNFLLVEKISHQGKQTEGINDVDTGEKHTE